MSPNNLQRVSAFETAFVELKLMKNLKQNNVPHTQPILNSIFIG